MLDWAHDFLQPARNYQPRDAWHVTPTPERASSGDWLPSPPAIAIGHLTKPFNNFGFLRVALQALRLKATFLGKPGPARIRHPDLHRPQTGLAQPGSKRALPGSRILMHALLLVTCNNVSQKPAVGRHCTADDNPRLAFMSRTPA